jgi:long-chain acyl-CoA synthetase
MNRSTQEFAMLNLATMLETSAREHPRRTAVVFGGLRLSYSQVNKTANQIANLLKSRGIGPGHRVALSCPNLPYFPFVYFGILKAGAAVVPLNVLLQAREIAYHLEDSQVSAFFCFEGTPELPLGERGRQAFQEAMPDGHFFVLPAAPSADEPELEVGETLGQALSEQPGEFETVQSSADDTAVILYTSGTTGRPKGAELSHSNMAFNAMVCDEMFGRAESDVFLTALPLFHAFGQVVMMNQGFRRAASLVLMPRFEAVQALELMRKEHVTFFAGVPTMYWGLLNAAKSSDGTEFEHLHTAVSGGAALPMEVLKACSATFGVSILEGYGLSETSPVASFNRPDRPTKAGTIGLPIWGVEMKLVDEEWNTVDGEGPGEIAIRGHNIMKGYYNKPEATAEVMRDGWFRSGDIATVDSDGYYSIIDRAKDMILRGGYNVYPREIEEVLLTHEAVSLAAVVGVADDELGEEVKAYVIRKPDAEIEADELVAWCKDNMASYKYPRSVEFRDSFPMTATGKILKRELR